jgi:hypothetical protein
VAQQGSSPRRPARPPQPDHRGRHDRSADRVRRADWQQGDPFGPESDDDLPAWAGPNDYPARPASTLQRPAARRSPRFGAEPGESDYGDAAADDWQAEDDWQPPDDWQAPDDRRANVDRGDGSAATTAPRPPGRRGRAAATRLRKSRRRVYRWCGIAIAACVIAAGVTALVTHHTPKPSLYVTSLLPGEFKSVPNACSSVSSTVLNQYLPGPGRTSVDQVSDSTQSQCSFTLDRKPDFLVLQVSAQAYQPFAPATAAGSAAGSASANAQDNYQLTYESLAKPPKISEPTSSRSRSTSSPGTGSTGTSTRQAESLLSPATISPLAKTGQQAIVAVQTEHAPGFLTDVVTVVIRERNVLITVSDSGQESGGGFGPVAVSTLEAGAEAVARDVLAKSLTEPRA